MSLYLSSHFTLKLFYGRNFFDYDNLKKQNGILNNDKKGKEINFAYYVQD